MRLDNIPRNCTPKISNTDGIILGRGLRSSCRDAIFLTSMVHFLRATAQTLKNKTAKFYFYWVCCFCRCSAAATCDGSHLGEFATSDEDQLWSAEWTADTGWVGRLQARIVSGFIQISHIFVHIFLNGKRINSFFAWTNFFPLLGDKNDISLKINED